MYIDPGDEVAQLLDFISTEDRWRARSCPRTRTWITSPASAAPSERSAFTISIVTTCFCMTRHRRRDAATGSRSSNPHRSTCSMTDPVPSRSEITTCSFTTRRGIARAAYVCRWAVGENPKLDLFVGDTLFAGSIGG